MIHFIAKGNIFKIEGVQNYAHGCNCAGAMGAGIAVQFKNRYPEMYKEYKRLCKAGEYNLGDVYTYQTDEGETIFNLATQKHWTTRAEMPALEQSLQKMMEYASANEVSKIALPAIGAGLGGGNWGEIKKIMQEVATDFPNVKLYVVEEFGDVEYIP